MNSARSVPDDANTRALLVTLIMTAFEVLVCVTSPNFCVARSIDSAAVAVDGMAMSVDVRSGGVAMSGMSFVEPVEVSAIGRSTRPPFLMAASPLPLASTVVPSSPMASSARCRLPVMPLGRSMPKLCVAGLRLNGPDGDLTLKCTVRPPAVASALNCATVSGASDVTSTTASEMPLPEQPPVATRSASRVGRIDDLRTGFECPGWCQPWACCCE